MKKTLPVKIWSAFTIFSMLAFLVYPVGIRTARAEGEEEEDTLIADLVNSRVIQVDSTGRIVWLFKYQDWYMPEHATRLPNGHILISLDKSHNGYDGCVIEIDLDGNIIWQYNNVFPESAERLANGNTLITDLGHYRVIEVTPTGDIVWEINNLRVPHRASRLSNGNTLLAERDNGRVIEVNSSGAIVWQVTGLPFVTSAQRLENGNTLLNQSASKRVFEVDSTGVIVWQIYFSYIPLSAYRISNGHTLVTGYSNSVEEIDSTGTVVWAKTGLNLPTSAERVPHINYVNQQPQASAGGPYFSDTHTPVTLDASASSDPLDEPLFYRWDFTNDGTWDTDWSSSPQFVYTWPEAYSGLVAVEASDGELSDTATAEATITQYINLPPVAEAGGPYTGDENTVISLDGSLSSDPLGDPLQYRWDFDNDGIWDTDWSSFPKIYYTSPDDYSGLINLEVTDGELSATDTAQITVNNLNPQTNILTGMVTADNYVVVSNSYGQTYFIDITNGSFSSPSLIDDKSNGMYGAGIGDFDNDGVLEILAGDDGNTWYYDKTGEGNSFAPAVSIDHSKHAYRGDFAEGDFDNDGNLDALMADREASFLTMYWGNGDGTFRVGTFTAVTDIKGLDAADFNNDGLMDFAAAIGKGNALVYLNRGDGNFAKPVDLRLSLRDASAISAGDFNGDGNADIVVGQSEMKFVPGNGNGTFDIPVALTFPYYAYAMAESDINGDGVLDLVFADGKSRMFYLTGNGDGTFTNQSYVIIKTNSIYGIATSSAGLPETTFNEGENIDFRADYSDQGLLDTHTASWDWGDGSPTESGTVTQTQSTPIIKGNVTGTHTYGDSGEYIITLTLQDDDGGVAIDSQNITVDNLPPEIEAGEDMTAYQGIPVEFSASLNDPGWLDTHTIVWDFGDGTQAEGLLNPTHVYPINDTYLVTLTVTDDDGAVVSDTLNVTVIDNTQPGDNVEVNPSEDVGVTFGGVTESGNTSVEVTTTNPGPDKEGFKFLGTYYDIITDASYTPPVTVCLDYDDTGLNPNRENNLKIFHWVEPDWIDATSSLDTENNIICGTVNSLSWFAVADDEDAPVITVNRPVAYGLYQINTALDFSAVDEGTGLASIEGVLTNTAGQVLTIQNGYQPSPGVYSLVVNATDLAGNASQSQAIPFVVYDPTGGFATGGGWFYPDSESNLNPENKATFGFVAKYKQEVSTGNLEFQYHGSDGLNLKSMTIDWLVISDTSAQFQGTGTINGEGFYTFRVQAKDFGEQGIETDHFDIRIWQGADTSVDPLYKAKNILSGGNIVVHKK